MLATMSGPESSLPLPVAPSATSAELEQPMARGQAIVFGALVLPSAIFACQIAEPTSGFMDPSSLAGEGKLLGGSALAGVLLMSVGRRLGQWWQQRSAAPAAEHIPADY
jgi:hypothetical protein